MGSCLTPGSAVVPSGRKVIGSYAYSPLGTDNLCYISGDSEVRKYRIH